MYEAARRRPSSAVRMMSAFGRLRTGADAGLQAHCQKLLQHDLNGYFERSFRVACRPLPPQFQKSASTETRSLTSAENGALGGTRTPNPLLRRQMLCPLSYEGVPAPYRNSRPPQTPNPNPSTSPHRSTRPETNSPEPRNRAPKRPPGIQSSGGLPHTEAERSGIQRSRGSLPIRSPAPERLGVQWTRAERL